MIAETEIEKMTLKERLQAMELLWHSISKSPQELESPKWHGEVIAKRLAKIDQGKAEFLTLARLKKRLGKRPK